MNCKRRKKKEHIQRNHCNRFNDHSVSERERIGFHDKLNAQKCATKHKPYYLHWESKNEQSKLLIKLKLEY